MTEVSNEALLMYLLEQIRSLEEDRDKAIELANDLNQKKPEVMKPVQQSTPQDMEKLETQNGKLKQTVGTLTQTVLSGLEEIRLKEEHRQYKLRELVVRQKEEPEINENDGMDLASCRVMLEMSKKYYGKLVSELREERDSLQQKLSQQRNMLLEKDMKIAELEMKLRRKRGRLEGES